MEKVIKKYDSFEEAEVAETEYWRKLSGNKKLEILEILRAQYWVIHHAEIRGFQRVYRIIKQA